MSIKSATDPSICAWLWVYKLDCKRNAARCKSNIEQLRQRSARSNEMPLSPGAVGEVK